MKTQIENLRPYVSEMTLPEDFEMYQNKLITLDYGTIKQKSEGTSQLKFTFEDLNEMPKTVKSSCGCTTPKILKPFKDEPIIVLELGYNTNLLGAFSKQVTLIAEDKIRKQIILIKGEVKKQL